MGGAVPPLPQCAFMAWCLVKAQGLYLYLYLIFSNIFVSGIINTKASDVYIDTKSGNVIWMQTRQTSTG
jgi:hypothetical protein